MKTQTSIWLKRYQGFISNKNMLIERLGRTHLERVIEALVNDIEATNYPIEVANLLQTKEDFKNEQQEDRNQLIQYYLKNGKPDLVSRLLEDEPKKAI